MYLLPTVVGGGIVVGGGFISGCLFVAAVESAAAFVGASPPPLHFIIGWYDFERCPSLAMISPSHDEAALPCLESTPYIMWDCRSVFLLDKACSLIFKSQTFSNPGNITR